MSQKEQIIDGYTVTFDSSWISRLEPERHWQYYWNQADLVTKWVNSGAEIIEVGVGTKFLSNYLRSRGYSVLTVDIDAEKKPDFVASASEFDYSTASSDVVVAFEIFEHIPFQTFKGVLDAIESSTVTQIIFSVPVRRTSLIRASIKVPKFKKIVLDLGIPSLKIRSKNHFWELSTLGQRELENNRRLLSYKEMYSVFAARGYNVKKVRRVGNIEFFVAERNEIEKLKS